MMIGPWLGRGGSGANEQVDPELEKNDVVFSGISPLTGGVRGEMGGWRGKFGGKGGLGVDS